MNPKKIIKLLTEENTSLKNKLKLFQTTEKLYKSSILTIKKYQREYQKTFIKALNDYKIHEDKIKKTYIQYQKLLEKHYKANEDKFLEENNALNMEIRQKNNIIKKLNKQISILNERISKTEFDCRYKNQILEDEVESKNRKLSELNESMFQLAKDTNDEIHLLRGEFKNYQINSIKNGEIKIDEDNNKINNIYSNNINELDIPLDLNARANEYYDKNMYNSNEINYFLNKLYLLETQNKNLEILLRRKDEELSLCNNFQNELLYNNSMNNYVSSIDKENNEKINLKIQNLEKTLINYGNKINDLKNKYNESLIRHQNEIQEIINNYENDINDNDNNDLLEENGNNDLIDYYNEEGNNFNEDYFNNYDINELEITNNINMNPFPNYEQNSSGKNINSEGGIKDEYINSKLPKINTLD